MSRNIKLLRCPGTPSVPNVLRHDIQDSGWSPGGLEPRGNWSPGDLESRGRGGGASGRSWQILWEIDRKSTRLNSSHVAISYAVFCLKKKKRDLATDDEQGRRQHNHS